MLNLKNRNATICADENGPGETTLDQVRSRIAAPAGVRFEDTRGTPGSLAAPRVAFDNDLGAACFEVTRLARQATFVRDLTEDVLRRAGVERGMRVLDLGCGNGDTSLLLAKLVGPSGLVVGVDPSLEAIDVAEKRATAAGRCYWTRFIAADLDTFVPDKPFDAVVARLILLRLRERAAALRLLSHLVRPHQVRPVGIVALQLTPVAQRARFVQFPHLIRLLSISAHIIATDGRANVDPAPQPRARKCEYVQ